MSSIYFPSHVVTLIRRLVHVFSGFSISTRYVLSGGRKPGSSLPSSEETPENLTPSNTSPSWSLVDFLRSAQRPWTLVLGRSQGNTINHWQRAYDALGLETDRTPVEVQPFPHPLSACASTSTASHDKSSTYESRPSPSTSQGPSCSSGEEDERHGSRPRPTDAIHQLLLYPALYDPLRVPRYPIVLCHGLYGFDTRGPSSFPSLQMNYWSNVLGILRDKLHAEVVVTSVPATGSITSRAESLDRQLRDKAFGRGMNFLAHSMGGLDCRHLITHTKPDEYVPLSLTTISTPHRGSPFMDWCAENIGIGKLARDEGLTASKHAADKLEASPSERSLNSSHASSPQLKSRKKSFTSHSLSSLPSSFTTLILSILDSPAYANLTSAYLNNVFNPNTPNDPHVKYFSVAGRLESVNIWHPFWLPKMVLDDVEEKQRLKLKSARENDPGKDPQSSLPLWARPDEWGNDGLVTVQSAKWGEFLGIMEGCDHWEMRGARGLEFGVDLSAFAALGLGGATSSSGRHDGSGFKWLGKWKREDGQPGDLRSAGTSATVAGTRTTAFRIDRKKEREMAREKDDDVVRSSTEKLSAVFDWIVEQIPAAPKTKDLPGSSGNGKANRAKSEMAAMTEKERKKREGKHELETKQDLERFYVALSRKLYEEGL